jgi:hypothetical protein
LWGGGDWGGKGEERRKGKKERKEAQMHTLTRHLKDKLGPSR